MPRNFSNDMERVAREHRLGRLEARYFDKRGNGVAIKSAAPNQADCERESQRTMRDALAKARAFHEGSIGVKLVMITRQPSKTGYVANIDCATSRCHRVAKFEIFKAFYLRIREGASCHPNLKTIICFSI